MSGMNPVILIQMIMKYSNPDASKEDGRVFTFMKNGLMRVHHETKEEASRRKSYISDETRSLVFRNLTSSLDKTLSGRLNGKKVWIDRPMWKIALPLEMSSGETGYGVLPTGSRIDIPEGKIVRAFTYWEKVNDIDLSCFAMSENGGTKEFSWRSMWHEQSEEIAFSGDVTNGFNGGSEYFDINLDLFKRWNPDYRYLIFCDNIFSDGGRKHFKDVVCKAGFMLRDEITSGEVYEPSTVKTSFRMTADGSFGYLFAIDLYRREMVWLNLARSGNHAIAGDTSMDVVRRYFTATDYISVGYLYFTAGVQVYNQEDADILVTDMYGAETEIGGKEIVRSCDFEKMLKLLGP